MRILLAVLAMALSQAAWGMERVQGWCEKGAQVVVAPSTFGGVPITRSFQQSYPACTVTVFVTGSGGTLANIYSTNSTGSPQANPFSADTTGRWAFYTPNGTVDVQISNGGLSTPYTFGALTAFDPADFTSVVTFGGVQTGTNTNQILTLGNGSSFLTAGSSIINFGSGGATTPWKVGLNASKPGACGVGQAYFSSDVTAGQNLYGCTSTNVWTQFTGGGGGGGSVPFSNVTTGTNNTTLTLGSGSLFNATGSSIINFSAGGHTTPWIVGAAVTRPPTCGPGEVFFATDLTPGSNINICTAANTWTVIVPSGGAGSFLPLAGGTMTGIITTNVNPPASGGAVFVPYPGSVQFQVSPSTGQKQTGISDVTLCDYFGCEMNFVRVKGTGSGTGDYFDWTRFGPSDALPIHQLNLNDSGFNTILNVNEVAGYPLVKFGFAGELTLGYCNDVSTPAVCTGITNDVGFTRSSTGVMELNNGSPLAGGGSLAQLNLLKVLVNRATDDGSGAALQITGNENVSGVIQSYATGTNLAFQANSGSFQVLGNGLVGAANYNVGAAGTIQWNAQQALRYNGGHLQFSDDGLAWSNVAQTATAIFTLSGNLLFPTSSADMLLIQRSTDDGSGAAVQIGGTGNLNAGGVIQSVATGTNLAFQANGGTFQVLGNGLVGAANFNVGTTGTVQWNAQPAFRYNTGHVQVSDDGSTWSNITGLAAGPWTLSSTLIFPTTVTNTVLVGRSTADLSGAIFEVAGDVNVSGVIQSAATGTNVAFQANGGTFQVLGNGLVGAANYNVGTSGTIQWNAQAALRFNAGHTQFSDDGANWFNIAGVASQWTVTGNTIFPQNTLARLLIQRTTEDGSGAAIQVAGNVNASGTIQSTATGGSVGFQVNGGTFQVLGNGTTGATAFNVATGGTIQWNSQQAIRYNLGRLQVSDNGSTWINVTSLGGGITSISGSGSGISVSPTTGAVVIQNTGVISATGSSINQVVVSAATGAVTFSLPQDIGTGSVVRHGGLLLNQANDGSGYTLQVAGGIETTGGGNNVLSHAVAFNAINAANGGINAFSGYWVNGTQVINSSGQWVNGGLVLSIASGGGLTVSPSQGAVTITNTGVTSITGTINQINVSGTTTPTLSLPQAINNTAVPQFSGMLLNQPNDGSGYTLQSNGGIEMKAAGANILSYGTAANAISTFGGINSTTGYSMSGVLIINNSNQFVGAGVNVGSNGISGGGYLINGGFVGQTWNVTFTGGISGAGAGCATGLVIRGGIVVSCF